jgi:hypothetical protein
MTDLIERTLHRLGEQRPGQISRPGDEDYAGGDSDLGEASRLHATRGQPPRAAYVRSSDKGTHLGLSATPKRRPRRLLHGKAGRRIA